MRFYGRFEGYDSSKFRRDLIAGLVVGVVAIPLGMAFAIASGVGPEYGLYTVIVAGILISLFGGSKYQIGGPTGAFVPILFGIVSQYGIENLLIAGFMAGCMLVLFGIFKLGKLMKFIPRPVIIGFTAGIAVIIFSGQIANFLGLKGVEKHESFFLNMREIVVHLGTANSLAIITAAIGLIVIVAAQKYIPKIPGALLGLLASTFLAVLFFQGQVETIGSAYGEIPRQLPSFAFPELTIEKMIYLLPPAIVIALLGGVESILSAMVADNMKGSKHDSNKELVGQGIANMAAPLFGGIPATGAIARTATNIKNGGASPISGVVHGVVVLLILMLFAPYASMIPLAAMAPILMFVAWNMSEKKEFINIVKVKNADSLVLVVTFLLTVIGDLIIGVTAGLILAFIAFIKKMSQTTSIHTNVAVPQMETAAALEKQTDQRGISMYSIEGPLFFGTTDSLENSILDHVQTKPKTLILLMNKVNYMDTSAEAVLMNISNRLKHHNGKLMIVGLQSQPKELLRRTGLFHHIGKQHFFERTDDISPQQL
ncbi:MULTISPECIES: SulP family inorganic anion transporter [Bacillus]|jgi:SulP family sulfate permease|uniref:SulP family inorganic anion transporter n=1 Tax=Bacillus TaxID=1386 RepID=UPI0007613FD1|nr:MULTISPECIES: SulP family inorganic anion transporter [Bacillus]AOC58673.1 sodium-independent anion transporter [Bacillus pumilus]MBR0586520.1 SulP family inorganic anion transporter [Bacillus pumilus DW2J2]MBR0618280.1 SulP family inorganic anion transporter [Bacillus pumilus]MBR0624270.1 SulP family inorganic anion transporter [Bacillus pumilus]MCK6163277.1 SulP family inorganic anion transporter [Bacillus pumilus]